MNETKELSKYEVLLQEESGLILQREKLVADIAPMESQFALAKAEAFKGIYMEPRAFREMENKVLAVRNSMRTLNVKIGQVQRKMGLAKRTVIGRNVESEKAIVQKKREMFVRAAQDILPEATFTRIWQVVEGRMKDLPQ